MTDFQIHTLDSAPPEGREKLEAVQSRMGFIPNLFGGLAEAPPALEAYLALDELLRRTSLSPAEQQVVLLSASVENHCAFCVAAHSSGALKAGASREVVDALRDGDEVPDARLGALAAFTQAVVRERGFVDERHMESFLEAGFSRANVLEVIMAVGMKTLSNYANHILETPLNEELSEFAWSAPST